MFRVDERRRGVIHQVFTWADPRKDGFRGECEDGVRLDLDPEVVYSWPEGETRPEACLGRAPDDPKQYKVFRYKKDLESQGYEPLSGSTLVFGSWADYLKIRRLPPDPEQTKDEDWYEYLDRVDDDSRERRRRVQSAPAPAGKSRDDVAAWVAERHRIVDSGIREVWYLPEGAPPDEIRFLEVNDRLAGDESKAEAVDFGLDVNGKHFTLCVADVTSDQLVEIERNPSILPAGWSLSGKKVWRRGA